MEQVYLNIAQSNVSLIPDKPLRQLASCRLANRRICTHWCAIALCMIHPALVIMGLVVMFRMSSIAKYQWCNLHTSWNSEKHRGCEEYCLLSPEKMMAMLCGIHFILVILRQRLIMSGDVELNPGPLDGKYNYTILLYNMRTACC